MNRYIYKVYMQVYMLILSLGVERVMPKIHMQKQSYNGYCVGVGVEYPGIIVSAESDEELVRRFKDAIPSYKRALEKFGVVDKENIAVITIDSGQMVKQ